MSSPRCPDCDGTGGVGSPEVVNDGGAIHYACPTCAGAGRTVADNLSCPCCGHSIPGEAGIYRDGWTCPRADCGAWCVVIIDEEGDACVSSWTCPHGRQDHELCEECGDG